MGRIHVIIGTDDLLVAEAAKKVVGDGVGLETIDSNASANEERRLRDLGEVELSYRTPPFLDPKKVTWWKNVNFLPGGCAKASEAVKDALDAFAKRLAATQLAENHEFLLTGSKLLKTSLFAKTLAPVAEMIVFEALKPREAAKRAVPRLIEMGAERKLVFAPGAAESFVARVGADTRTLLNELEKTDLFLGPGERTVTKATIEAIVSQGVGVEPEVWAITDALGARRADGAVAAALKFAGEGGFSVLVTSVAERFFREAAALKDAAAKGRWEEATASMAPWQANRMRSALRNWRLVELRNAQRRFMKLRELSVSASGDSVDAQIVIDLARVCGGHA